MLSNRWLNRVFELGLITILVVLVASCQTAGSPINSRAASRVLLVCNGSTKPCPRDHHYATVQAAVNSARPGDWVLIWPGVYHENYPAHHAGVWITVPQLHIRGMNRKSVVIDGSKGRANNPCPSDPSLQNFTPRDGIVISRASGVTIQNLTVCNYLAGSGARHGSQVWWTGGLGSFDGSYLTTTSMYHPANPHNRHLAEFGIYAGNAHGPGKIANSYASNMANAAYYVGACGRTCNTTLSGDRGTNSAAGYLGTNSGGRLVIEHSTFDNNRTGMVLLSLNTDDLPPPQDGRCPGSSTMSCTLIDGDLVENNNNADAPAFGITPAIGVGIEISGGRFDTISHNMIKGNGSWGVIAHDNPDFLSNLRDSHCQGGVPNMPIQDYCLFVAQGNEIFANTLKQNGAFDNPTNGDLANLNLAPAPLAFRNCFYGNNAQDQQISSSPAEIEAPKVDGPPCGRAGTTFNSQLWTQLGCADHTQCKDDHANYPSSKTIDAVVIPALPTMPNPCADVPKNQFCP